MVPTKSDSSNHIQSRSNLATQPHIWLWVLCGSATISGCHWPSVVATSWTWPSSNQIQLGDDRVLPAAAELCWWWPYLAVSKQKKKKELSCAAGCGRCQPSLTARAGPNHSLTRSGQQIIRSSQWEPNLVVPLKKSF